MVVRSARNKPQASLDQALAQCRRVSDHVIDVLGERRLQGLAKRNRLTCDHVHEGAALGTGEHRLVDCAGKLLVISEDEPAARAAKGLMAGRGHHVRVREGRWMGAGSDQAGDMGHIDHKARAHAVRDGRHALEIDGAGICRGASHDQARTMLLGQALKLVIVDGLRLKVKAVRNEVVQLA